MAKTTAGKSAKKKETKNASSSKAKAKKVSKASKSESLKISKKKTKSTHSKKTSANRVDKNKEEIFNKTVLVIVTVIALLVLVVGGIIYFSHPSNDVSAIHVNSTSENVSKNVSSSSSIKLLVVEDPTCKSCHVDLVVDKLKSTIMPGLKVEKVDYNSPQGQSIVKEFNLTQVPAYFFSSDITKLKNWDSQLKLAFRRVNIDGKTYYMLNPMYVSDKVILKEVPLLNNAIIMGNPDAKVTLYEFSDFRCPFCSIAAGDPTKVELFRQRMPGFVPPLPHVIEDYVNSGKVKIVFYNFPIHQYSEEAAEAGWCANEQGKFYPMYKKLFYNQEEWANENYSTYFNEFAKEIGLDVDKFDQCLSSNKYKSEVEKEKDLGIQFGVTGTPTFFVGRQMIQGAQNYSVFKEAIDAALSK